MTSRREGQSRNTMLDSSDFSYDDTISYLKDVDSDIRECYVDHEPLTGPQPYTHEPGQRQRLCLCGSRINMLYPTATVHRQKPSHTSRSDNLSI